MLDWGERVNCGMYMLLHNDAQAMAAMGHLQPSSVSPGDRLVMAVKQPVTLSQEAAICGT